MSKEHLHFHPLFIYLTAHRFAPQQAYRHTIRLDAAKWNVVILRQHAKAKGCSTASSTVFPDVADPMTELSTKVLGNR